MKHFAIAVAILLGSSGFASAGHTDVPIIEESRLVSQGFCRISSPGSAPLVVPCEMYIGPDGSRYVAMYLEGRIQVVKRQNADGTQENVYVRVSGVAI